ncbi:MAG: HEAT repeat domain-containing protein, partial [Verrucomicrobia bacterium]|nr:HEAT repeat domain-containing protein [Verrucomicrobiota bacterium]
MRSEQKLSRTENLFQSPGIVLVVAGYVLMSFASLFLFAGLRGTSFEPNISLFLLLPFEIFFLMNLYPAMTGGDRRKISSVKLLLVAQAIYIGGRYIYAAIEYPNVGALEYPRTHFASYVGTFTVAVGQLVAVVTWFLLLFAPNVRRWVRAGAQSEGETAGLRIGRLTVADSASKRGLGGWGIVRVLGCLLFGAAVYSSILFSGSILSRNVLPADQLSFDELMDQLETEDHWQLRLRHNIGFFVAKDILKYSSAKMAELPPTTVHGLRVEALDGLARFGPRAIGPLKQALSDSDLSLRRVAVEALGTIGTEAVEISETLRSMVLDLELSGRPAGSLYLRASLHRELLLALLKIAPDDPLTEDTFLEVFEIAKGPGLRSLVVDLANDEGLESGLGQRQLERLLSGGIDPTKFYV